MNRIIPTLATIAVLAGIAAPAAADEDAERLIAALLGDTPVIEDLWELTDSIGGRQTVVGRRHRVSVRTHRLER